MYEAGFKQKQVWIKRKPVRQVKMDLETFFRKMEKLTSGWNESSLSQLFSLLIGITESKKEVNRIAKNS
jgi:hypothetical protein